MVGTPESLPRVRVLHVDAEHSHHEAVRSILRGISARIDVYAATCSGEALRALEAFQFDALVLEVHLGPEKEGGFRVLERVRSCSDIPAIFLTASTSYRVVARCAELRATYLPKQGVDFDDLAARLLATARARRTSGTYSRVRLPPFPVPEAPSGVRLVESDPIREAAQALMRAEGSLSERLDQTKRCLARALVEAHRGNRTAAARSVQTSRQNLQLLLSDDDD